MQKQTQTEENTENSTKMKNIPGAWVPFISHLNNSHKQKLKIPTRAVAKQPRATN